MLLSDLDLEAPLTILYDVRIPGRLIVPARVVVTTMLTLRTTAILEQQGVHIPDILRICHATDIKHTTTSITTTTTTASSTVVTTTTTDDDGEGGVRTNDRDYGDNANSRLLPEKCSVKTWAADSVLEVPLVIPAGTVFTAHNALVLARCFPGKPMVESYFQPVSTSQLPAHSAYEGVVLLRGTTLPAGTLLPAGSPINPPLYLQRPTLLVKSLTLPAATLLPRGTILSSGGKEKEMLLHKTLVPAGRVIHPKSVLPARTRLPPGTTWTPDVCLRRGGQLVEDMLLSADSGDFRQGETIAAHTTLPPGFIVPSGTVFPALVSGRRRRSSVNDAGESKSISPETAARSNNLLLLEYEPFLVENGVDTHALYSETASSSHRRRQMLATRDLFRKAWMHGSFNEAMELDDFAHAATAPRHATTSVGATAAIVGNSEEDGGGDSNCWDAILNYLFILLLEQDKKQQQTRTLPYLPQSPASSGGGAAAAVAPSASFLCHADRTGMAVHLLAHRFHPAADSSRGKLLLAMQQCVTFVYSWALTHWTTQYTLSAMCDDLMEEVLDELKVEKHPKWLQVASAAVMLIQSLPEAHPSSSTHQADANRHRRRKGQTRHILLAATTVDGTDGALQQVVALSNYHFDSICRLLREERRMLTYNQFTSQMSRALEELDLRRSRDRIALKLQQQAIEEAQDNAEDCAFERSSGEEEEDKEDVTARNTTGVRPKRRYSTNNALSSSCRVKRTRQESPPPPYSYTTTTGGTRRQQQWNLDAKTLESALRDLSLAFPPHSLVPTGLTTQSAVPTGLTTQSAVP